MRGVAFSLLAFALACGAGGSGASDAGADAADACSGFDGGYFLLATGQSQPNGIAFDGKRVFWANSSGSITSASLCGDPVIVAPESGMAIAIDADSVYWTHRADSLHVEVRSAPRAGGPAITVASTPMPDALSNLAVDDTYSYYGSTAGVVRVLKTGEPSGTVLERPGWRKEPAAECTFLCS